MAKHEDDAPETGAKSKAEAEVATRAKAEGGTASDGQAVYDVPVELSAVLGTAHIPVSQLLKMGRGAVLELDRVVGDPVEIYVNSQLVARGEVVVVNDHLGVTLTNAIKTPPR